MPVGSERIAQALSAGIGDLESARPGIALSQSPRSRATTSRRVARSRGGQRSRVADLPDGPDAAGALAISRDATAIARSAKPSSRRRAGARSQPLLAMLRAGAPARDPDPEAQREARPRHAPSASSPSLERASRSSR